MKKKRENSPPAAKQDDIIEDAMPRTETGTHPTLHAAAPAKGTRPATPFDPYCLQELAELVDKATPVSSFRKGKTFTVRHLVRQIEANETVCPVLYDALFGSSHKTDIVATLFGMLISTINEGDAPELPFRIIERGKGRYLKRVIHPTEL